MGTQLKLIKVFLVNICFLMLLHLSFNTSTAISEAKADVFAVTNTNVGPVNPTLGAGETISVTLTQNIPGAPPAGQYTYIFNVGAFSNTINDSDSFQFTKLNAPSALQKSSSGETDNWAVIGAEGVY